MQDTDKNIKQSFFCDIPTWIILRPFLILYALLSIEDTRMLCDQLGYIGKYKRSGKG